MYLKRKRSDSELSHSSSGTLLSSPPRPCDTVSSSFSFFSPMDTEDSVSPRPRSFAPAHLSGRTMKRFRNSRPSEEEVHQHTLKMLYTAQQQHSQEQHPNHISTPPVVAPQPSIQHAAPVRNQASLHSFWKLPSAPASSLSTPSTSVLSIPTVDLPTQPTSCDDCGAELNTEADAMDVDGVGGNEHTCGACGKAVCFSCSVSNLGERRRCLACAGRKAWPGDAGWTTINFTTC